MSLYQIPEASTWVSWKKSRVGTTDESCANLSGFEERSEEKNIEWKQINISRGQETKQKNVLEMVESKVL